MIVIPARLASTRFKNKILQKIGEVPMFIATAQNAEKIDSVLIAVDDENVLKIANNYGLNAVMTSDLHKSGTDRINEAVIKFGAKDDEVIVNVQAAEPFFESENLEKFIKFAHEKIAAGAFMASCFKRIGAKEACDPNLVKVITDISQNAIYFSRSVIPFAREKCESYKGHIGIYAYSARNLREFCKFGESFLESIEKLEQLRAIEWGKKIAMCEIMTHSIGIDTLVDYERALAKFGKK